jgi:steroid 5-alpha reductase family enzyme
VPHLCYEPHLWWIVGVVVWEFKLSFEVPALQKVNDFHEDFFAQFSDCLPHTKYQLAPQK